MQSMPALFAGVRYSDPWALKHPWTVHLHHQEAPSRLADRKLPSRERWAGAATVLLKTNWSISGLHSTRTSFSKQDPVLIQKLEWAYPRNTVRSLHEGSCWLQRAYLIPHCRIREMKSMHGCELGKKEQSKLLRLNAPLEIQILLTEFLHVEKKWQIIKMIFLYFIFSTSSDKLRSSYFSITINRHSSSPYPYQTQPKYILLAHFLSWLLRSWMLPGKSKHFPILNTTALLRSGYSVYLQNQEVHILWWTDGPHSCIFWIEKDCLKKF